VVTPADATGKKLDARLRHHLSLGRIGGSQAPAAGSGGAAAADLPVVQDDRIELSMYRPLGTFIPGTLVGMNYQIRFVPEPTGLIFAATAMIGLFATRSRRRWHGHASV
jgi:hypothetical protein